MKHLPEVERTSELVVKNPKIKVDRRSQKGNKQVGAGALKRRRTKRRAEEGRRV
jgi:hypothetical protein